MSEQRTFAGRAWTEKKKVTRGERFLAEMNAVIPWAAMVAAIAPHHPTAGRRRRSMSLGANVPLVSTKGQKADVHVSIRTC